MRSPPASQPRSPPKPSRPIRADRLRFLDIQRDAKPRWIASCDQGLHAEIFDGQHLKIMQRTRNDGADDDTRHCRTIPAVQRQQLTQPHRIFVCRPARIGRNAPARDDSFAVDQREHDIGIAGVDR